MTRLFLTAAALLTLLAFPRAGRGAEWRTAPALSDDPAGLLAHEYVPDGLGEGAPLVVALHACEQGASDYDRETGWLSVAEGLGFAMLFPEQQLANNPSRCFNWFAIDDGEAGDLEAASLIALIDDALMRHRLDANRVFVTGLSAGAAMAQVLLARAPERFAGGGLVAGVPVGCAQDLTSAFQCLRDPGAADPQEWGHRLKEFSDHSGPWPRVILWHGTEDRVVDPANTIALATQWREVHGLAGAESVVTTTGNITRERWGDGAVERVTIRGMGHASPVDLGAGCGEPDPFTQDVGLCGPRVMAEFWRLDQPASEPPRFVPLPDPPREPKSESGGCAAAVLLLPWAYRRRR